MKSSGPTKSKKVVASRSTTVKKTQVNRGDKGEENLGSTLSQLQLGYEQSGDSSTLMTVFGPEAIDGIKISNLNNTSNNQAKKISKNKFSYSIKVADFYYKKTANLMIDRIREETSIKKINLIELSKTNYRVLLGPFNDIYSLKESFEKMNFLNFENLEILKDV